jgi:ABC-2 type transport system ATP-binding protein
MRIEPPYIDARNLCMRFDAVTAVEDVSFTVNKGLILGIVGSDGAGKSTLLRMIAGMLNPVSGTLTIDGKPAMKNRQAFKSLIGYMPQRFGLYEDLTVEENIDFFLDIFGIFGEERNTRKNRFLGFSNLLPFTDRPAGMLSGGMKQKLGLACVLVHQPKILILDEPTNGVDPVSRAEFWDILFHMKSQGMTLLVSTAYLDEAEKCDTLAFMHRSRLLALGTPGEIQKDFPNLEEALINGILQADGESGHDGFKF